MLSNTSLVLRRQVNYKSTLKNTSTCFEGPHNGNENIPQKAREFAKKLIKPKYEHRISKEPKFS